MVIATVKRQVFGLPGLIALVLLIALAWAFIWSDMKERRRADRSEAIPAEQAIIVVQPSHSVVLREAEKMLQSKMAGEHPDRINEKTNKLDVLVSYREALKENDELRAENARLKRTTVSSGYPSK